MILGAFVSKDFPKLNECLKFSFEYYRPAIVIATSSVNY
jgi:hypothetical protein